MPAEIRYAEGVPGFPAQGLGELLDQLDGLRRRSADLGPESLPLLTLHLRNGLEVQGWLLDWRRSGKATPGGPVLLLNRASADRSRPTDDLFFTMLAEVGGITVHNAIATARHARPSVTPLALERLVVGLGECLGRHGVASIRTRLDRSGFAEGDLAVAADVVRNLQAALEAIVADSTGRTAAQQRLKGVRVQAGKTLSLSLKASELLLTIPPDPGELGGASSFQGWLEKIL